jgi:hypothetical protein
MVTIRYFHGDLFNSNNNLAHCVSADMAMSKGIALTFRNKFGRVDELIKQDKSIGSAPFLIYNSKLIYYLVTKEKYWMKPSIETLELCLVNMRNHMLVNNINHISIPKLGCGLDRLKWCEVKDTITTIFKDDNITIDVYSL